MPLYCTNLGIILTSNVQPSSFVSMDPTTDFGVYQSSGNSFLIGIAQAGTREPVGVQTALWPGTTPVSTVAGIATDSIEVFHQGDVCGLQVGSAAVNCGDQLTNDGNGYGLTAITGSGVNLLPGRAIGAIALQAGNVGDIINVLVAYSKS